MHQAAAPTERAQGRDALELDRGSDQGPAAGEPGGDRQQEDRARQQRDDHGRDEQCPQQRRDAVGGQAVGAQGSDRTALVDLDQRPGGRGLRDSQSEQRQRGSDGEHDERDEPVALAGRLDAEHVGRVQHQGLQQRHEQCDGHEYDADSDEEGEPGQVHACGGGQDLTPGAAVRNAERSRRAPGDPGEQDDREQDEPGEQQAELERVVDQPDQRSRTPADCAAEETGGAGPNTLPPGTV